jgi:hypothetical protein
MIYTKEEFKNEWENNPDCKITFDDCADCAKDWGVISNPKYHPIEEVRHAVLRAANCIDAEEYNPDNC